MSHEDDLSFLAPPGEVADYRLVVAFDAAAEMSLFEELPATPSEAATRLGIDERAVRILLGALSVWGVVEELDGSYSICPERFPSQGEAATLRHHAQVLRTWSTQLDDRLRGVPPAPSSMTAERRRRWLEAPATVLRWSWRPVSDAFRRPGASWTWEGGTASMLAPSPGEARV